MVEVPTWLEGDGVSMAATADVLPPKALGWLTEMRQAEIRNSPLTESGLALMRVCAVLR